MSDRPVKEFRAGGVRAAIWENERGAGDARFTAHTISIERRFKDRDGLWKSTTSFRVEDLASLQLVAAKAFEFLTLKERAPQDEPAGAPENGE